MARSEIEGGTERREAGGVTGMQVDEGAGKQSAGTGRGTQRHARKNSERSRETKGGRQVVRRKRMNWRAGGGVMRVTGGGQEGRRGVLVRGER